MLKAGTFFFIVTLKSNIFLSYMIVSYNDDKGHAKFTVVCLGREGTTTTYTTISKTSTTKPDASLQKVMS